MQAIRLDDGHVYTSRLQLLLHRLELRSELYKPPQRGEDVAASIIEQVVRLFIYALTITLQPLLSLPKPHFGTSIRVNCAICIITDFMLCRSVLAGLPDLATHNWIWTGVWYRHRV